MADILDELLQEALSIELRNRRGQGSVKRLKEIQRICTQSLHSRSSWTKTRVILILHNEVGAIGYFEEFIHKSSLARQLHRLDSEPHGHYELEIVSGPEWTGGPRIHLVDPPTETEISLYRKAFHSHTVRFPWKHLRGAKRSRPLHFDSDRIIKDLCA